MNIYLTDLCEQIDASLFNGDGFYNEQAIEKFEQYVQRWKREIKQIKESLAEDINT